MNIHQWRERYVEVVTEVNTQTGFELESLDCRLTTLSQDLFETERKQDGLEKRMREIFEMRSHLNTQVEILNRNLAHLSTGILGRI